MHGDIYQVALKNIKIFIYSFLFILKLYKVIKFFNLTYVNMLTILLKLEDVEINRYNIFHFKPM
jgi:hypothetical protein